MLVCSLCPGVKYDLETLTLERRQQAGVAVAEVKTRLCLVQSD